MQTRRVVTIGTSSGGIDALRTIIGALPRDFDAAIAIVVHTSPESPGVLPEIIRRSGPLDAPPVRSGEGLRRGVIYVAPPDHHMLIEPGRIRLTKGPRENRFRPAIDPLFRSAAQVYGPAAIGVVLTGNLDDGTAGLWAIKQLGGTAIVQDPKDALYPSMPQSALRHVKVDYCVPLAEIAPLLVRLTTEAVDDAQPREVPEEMAIEVKIAGEEDPIGAGVTSLGKPSIVACPECHGVLLQVKEAGRARFRCHTGHAYSAESLLSEITEGVEVALWNALRSAQEGSMLMHQLAEHDEVSHAAGDRARLLARARELDEQAAQLRAMVTSTPTLTTEP
jgi:two-component system chemotaxis response regulator CheB